MQCCTTDTRAYGRLNPTERAVLLALFTLVGIGASGASVQSCEVEDAVVATRSDVDAALIGLINKSFVHAITKHGATHYGLTELGLEASAIIMIKGV